MFTQFLGMPASVYDSQEIAVSLHIAQIAKAGATKARITAHHSYKLFRAEEEPLLCKERNEP